MEKDNIVLIYNQIQIAKDNKDKLDFSIEDGIEHTFGRVYYYVKFNLTNKPGVNEHINKGYKDTIRFFLGDELPKSGEGIDEINRINETNYRWITGLCDLHLKNSGVNSTYRVYPYRIKGLQSV